jgi:hypothetical protein
MGGSLAHGLKQSIALLLCEAAKPSFRVIERMLPFFRRRISSVRPVTSGFRIIFVAGFLILLEYSAALPHEYAEAV